VTAAEFAARLPGGARRRGDTGWYDARCPGHEDHRDSLSFRDGDVRVITKCHAGCDDAAIVAGLGLTMADLFHAPAMTGNGKGDHLIPPHIVATYDYRDAAGTLRYQVVRYEPKGFAQRHPDPAAPDGWAWNMRGVERIPYRLPELANVERVVVAEGEKDCGRLAALGIPATCNVGGAGKWKAAETAALVEVGVHAVVVIPDNDQAGEKHAQAVGASCHGAGLTVALLRLPGLPPMRDKHGEDASNWLDAGHTADELRALIETAPAWTPDLPPTPVVAPEAEPPLTDRGNAERFAREHRGTVRYCPERGWLPWDGTRYPPDPALIATLPLVKATARRFLERTMADPTTRADRARIKHALYSEGAPGLRRALDLAQSEPGIPVRLDELDPDPWRLNTPSGIVDQTMGGLGPHDPKALMTRITAARYDPKAECPKFLSFLARTFKGRPRLIAYVQCALGMATTGKSERVLLVFHGIGHNGKTTLINIVRGVLGDDYTAGTPVDTVLVKRGDSGIPNDLARLAGRRLVLVAEVEGRRRAEGLVKQLTGGGEKIPARFMRGEWFEHVADYTLLLTANRPPRITGTDPAIWERVHLVPFEVVIPPKERERDLADRLVREEGPGILRWLVEGAMAWHKAGRLAPPDEVTAATQAYRDEQDALRPFLTDRCALGATGRVPVADLYANYTAWAKESGETPLSKTELRRALMARGLPEPKRAGHGGVHTWSGLRLLADGEPQRAEASATASAELNLW
jgi:putative DNA primase/helicase